MPDCEYCGTSLPDEDSYRAHLKETHPEELGPIDRRKLGLETEGESADEGRPYGLIVIGIAVLAVLGVTAVTAFWSGGGAPGSGAAQQPSNYGAVHYHGTIEMTVTGHPVDFSRAKYQQQADAFHFEGGGGTRWHVHADGVTVEFAMATLGIEVTDSTVTFQGRTYANSDANTTVEITVNGNDVTPSEYVLQPGDEIRIVVEEG